VLLFTIEIEIEFAVVYLYCVTCSALAHSR